MLGDTQLRRSFKFVEGNPCQGEALSDEDTFDLPVLVLWVNLISPLDAPKLERFHSAKVWN
jgi:hypothetical protein